MSRTWSRADEGCCGAMAYPFLLGWPSCGYPSFVDYIPSAGRSDAVAVGGVGDHLRLPSERGTWPSKLAAMIMRRVGPVNSCHRPLPGYALALTMSVRAPGCRRGCGWAGGPGGPALRPRRVGTAQQPGQGCLAVSLSNPGLRSPKPYAGASDRYSAGRNFQTLSYSMRRQKQV